MAKKQQKQKKPERILPYQLRTGDKQKTRETLIRLVEEHLGRPRRMLLLPGAMTIDGRAFKKRWRNVGIQAIEKDRKIYNHIRRKQPDWHPRNLTVEEYVEEYNSTHDTFDVIWLDTTNAFGQDALRSVHKIVANMLDPKAILALTYVVNGRAKAKESAEILARQEWQEDPLVPPTHGDPQRFAECVSRFVDLGETPTDTPKGGLKVDLPYPGLAWRLNQHQILHTSTYRSRAGSMDMYFAVFYYERTSMIGNSR